MKKIIFLMIVIILFIGCAREADLVFDNRTSHYLYYTIDDVPQEPLAGQTARKHTFKIGTQYLFNTPEKTVKVTAKGETFVTPGEGDDRYIILDNRYYKKDYNLIFYPNQAGFKIINESSEVITSFTYRIVKINGTDSHIIPFINGLQPGEEYWDVLPYNDYEDANYTYRFEMTTNSFNDTFFVLADSLILGRGEQFLYYHRD